MGLRIDVTDVFDHLNTEHESIQVGYSMDGRGQREEGGRGERGDICTTAYPRRYPIRRRLPTRTTISISGSDDIRVLHADDSDASEAWCGFAPSQERRGSLLLTVLAGIDPSWMVGETCTTVGAEHHIAVPREWRVEPGAGGGAAWESGGAALT